MSNRAREILESTLPLDARERRAFLDEACGGDAALRDEVEDLLARHEETAETREDCGAARSEAEQLQPPVSVAGHRIHFLIGEGGMGQVYRAEQLEPIRRAVALKVIRHGMETREVVARFESERQALALMNHANVARVFGAGATDQGRPYFSMEFVKGVSITTYCDRHRLTVDERLRLFTQVCDGVRHAHQKGIIHRDLKPSNVLVTIEDENAVPKIIDFGVAKAIQERLTDRTLFTQVGQLVGTPAYMSPEQAEMTQQDIDTRTDVYSLGVVLYELLTGALPFDSSDLKRAGDSPIERLIREVEPLRPSTRVSSDPDRSSEAARNRRTDARSLSRGLRGDLDWITMKALEKDRTRRYGSPSDLADDITRYLEHQPVEAGPPTVAYRFGKFARRHRVGLAAATAIAATMIIALVVSLGALTEARREANTSSRVLEFLSNVFIASDPYVAKGEDISARSLLDRAVESIDSELEDQPRVRVRLKNLMGSIYVTIGDYERAEKLLTEALETRTLLLGPEHLEVADSLHALSWLRFSQGHWEESRSLAEQGLEIRRQVYGESHLGTADSLYRLAFAETELGENQSALGHLQEALRIKERALGPAHPEVGEIHSQLGWVFNITGQDGAQAHLEQALTIMEREYGDESVQAAQCLHRLALVLTKKGDYQRARLLHERTLQINEKIFGPDHPRVADSLNNLGTFAWYASDLKAAKGYWERALTIREQAFGPDHPMLAQSLMNLALVLQAEGEGSRALSLMQRSLAIKVRTFGEESEEIANARINLGVALSSLGFEDEAERELQRALTVHEKLLGRESEQVATAVSYLGDFKLKTGKFDESREYFERALSIYESVWGADNPNLHGCVHGLASANRYLKRWDEAEALYQRALVLAESAHGPGNLKACVTVMGLANLQAGRGDLDRASETYSRAEALLKALGRDEEDYWIDDLWRAEYWALMGERGKAVGHVRAALEHGCRKSRILRDPELSQLQGDPEFQTVVAAF